MPPSVTARAALAAMAALLALAACGEEERPASAETPQEATPSALLNAAVAAAHRSEDERARDQWRHPKETLEFFGVAPDATVVEIWPGGGWYTNILSPYLRYGGGTLYAATVDPALSEFAAAARDRLSTRFADSSVYGNLQLVSFAPGGPAALAPVENADVVLTFRNAHNWIDAGVAEPAFTAFFNALKPGGVLGVVEHRADPAAADGESHGGYVTETTIIALAEAAGFILEARSEINANPADTKNHPFGVWTLPPVSRRAQAPGLPDVVDPSTYEAIGESDRMTLKFRKPVLSEATLEDEAPQ
ncbi:MAG: hypothetical protein AAFX08_01570 [Pseudomonadota bacterium]